MTAPERTVVVPTRGDPAALRHIATNIAAGLGAAPFTAVLNRAAPPAPDAWAMVLGHCPDASFHLSPGGGVARARNLALRITSTDVVVFVDDDVVVPPDSLATLVAYLEHLGAGVATARIWPAPSTACTDALHRDFIGLDRGPVSRSFTRQDLDRLSPMTAWTLGVGAVFAVRRSMLDAVAHPPIFDETLSNGRFCGGAEDVDFFLQCLLSDIPVAYCADAVVEHNYPTSLRCVRTKMTQYARADGAFYAKWRHLLGWRDVAADLLDWSRRVEDHFRRDAAHRPHLPLATSLHEPADKLIGAAWWRLIGTR